MNFLDQLTVTEIISIATAIGLAISWFVSHKMTAAKSRVDNLSLIIDSMRKDLDRLHNELDRKDKEIELANADCDDVRQENKVYREKERTWEKEKDAMFLRIKELEKEMQELRQALELNGLIKS